MSYFELSGRELDVESAVVYENGWPGAQRLFEITNEIVPIEGVVLIDKKPGSFTQDPYAYIGESAAGFWLRDSVYTLLEGPTKREVGIRLYGLYASLGCEAPRLAAQWALQHIKREDYPHFLKEAEGYEEVVDRLRGILASRQAEPSDV